MNMELETPSSSPSNLPVLGRWRLVKPLGSGATSKVYLGVDPDTNEQAAVKIFVPSKDSLALLESESEILQDLAHPNILSYIESDASAKLYDPSTERSHRVQALAMEYASKGELFDYLQEAGYFPEDIARKIFTQLIDAISHLHERNIVHRDIKLENILLDEQFNVKLADFGYSSYFHPGRLYRTAAGTSSYFSPEMHEKSLFSVEKADLFAAGLVLFALVTGHMPFVKADKEDQAYRLFASGEKSVFWRFHKKLTKKKDPEFKLSDEFIDLAEKMFDYDPKKRPSIKEIRDHPWMTAKSTTA